MWYILWNVIYSVHLGKFTLAQRKIPSRHHGRWFFFFQCIRKQYQNANSKCDQPWLLLRKSTCWEDKQKRRTWDCLHSPSCHAVHWTAVAVWYTTFGLVQLLLYFGILLRHWVGNRLHIHGVLPFTFRWIQVNIKYVQGKQCVNSWLKLAEIKQGKSCCQLQWFGTKVLSNTMLETLEN